MEDRKMRSKLLLTLAAVAMLGGAAYSTSLVTTGERSDCPGKIICPIDGEKVCKDRCPLLDPNRNDCPGKIEYPLTGELVCRDECPIDATTQAKEDEIVRSCCRQKASHAKK